MSNTSPGHLDEAIPPPANSADQTNTASSAPQPHEDGIDPIKSTSLSAENELQILANRSSLEAIENAPQEVYKIIPQDFEAAAVALPAPINEESVQANEENGNEDRNATNVEDVDARRSLDVLISVPLHAYVSLPENQDAISTRLPASIDGQPPGDSTTNPQELALVPTNPAPSTRKPKKNKKKRGKPSEKRQDPPVRPYASLIEILQKPLPHLENVRKAGRQKAVKVEYYDFIREILHKSQSFSTIEGSDESNAELYASLGRTLRDSPAEGVDLRIIIATDLSTGLIECLGSTLNVSPEVFEEHLLNSGWADAEYGEKESDTWNTRDMEKNYITTRWYRPVKRILPRPYSSADRFALLSSRRQELSWTEPVRDESTVHGVNHISKPTTNIWRRDWDMKTDSETKTISGVPAAWEERMTIWNKKCEGYRVILLILDPLPILQDQMTGAVSALQTLGFYQPPSPVIKPRSRRPPLLLTDTTRNNSDDIVPNPDVASTLPPVEPPPKPLVKSSTFVRSRPRSEGNFSIKTLFKLVSGKGNVRVDVRKGATSVDVEVDVDDPESGQRGRVTSRKAMQSTRPKTRNILAGFMARLTGGRPVLSEKDSEPQEPADPEVDDEAENTEIKTLFPVDRCIFEGLVPRGPMIDYETMMSPDNINEVGEYMNCTKSTARSIAEWLRHDAKQEVFNSRRLVDFMFGFVQRDTSNTLHIMDQTLREIGQHILDDTLIQQRLVHWRHLLERFDVELQQLEDSLRRFAKFIEENFDQTKRTGGEGKPNITHDMLKEGVTQIASLRQRTAKSYKSLMANMSIVESKRGIAEAESVTKLTELAFFFIPLTFSAGIFSMQVKELSSPNLSISSFFATAIIITTCSYTLRLFIRSAAVIEFRRKYMNIIRLDAGLPPGASIPTTSFLAWVWRRLGLLTILVTLLVALLVVPIAVLWSRDMNRGFKALVTVLLLIMILVASYVVVTAMLYTDRRGHLHFRRDIFTQDKMRDERPQVARLTFRDFSSLFSWFSSRWFLLAATAAAVGVGPLAALWTRPLETGIKAGATVAIVLILICFLVFILLRALSEKLERSNVRDSDDDIFD